ncbi:hypothetical protein CP973_28375 [Streptomyces albofaciens JCM 4342]|uniref:hypothetical protein n=1 Tax=Streptomyces albofaciens TaxID=66866 RepID=UPI00123C13B7|nr:hypothetical protein [Streptomyces albofaciens]KAA6213199.1 hypothetical protein CP973_28375 [Streptomyces albofaciens JCM 4342]
MTACQVIDEAVGADARIVTDAGLRRLCGTPHRSSRHHAHRYVVCGRNGPPGRQVPVTVGVRVALDALGHRDTVAVALLRADELPYVTAPLAYAVRHEVPFVLAAIGPGGRAGEQALKLMRVYGCSAHRVDDPAACAQRPSGPARKP